MTLGKFGTDPKHVLYLHGFASSARSTKASIFAERLAPHGIQLHTPDFNEPDFSTLTMSRLLEQTSDAMAALPTGSVALIGSSLGGFVAVHSAAAEHGERTSRPARIDRLILLAPALDFGANRGRGLTRIDADRMDQTDVAALEHWRVTDRLDVFHYGFGRTMPLRYALYEDAGKYDSFAVRADVPILIFQGRRDESVDPAMVQRFAQDRPNVTLRLLDDDHQLLGSMEQIWQESARFLSLTR